MFHQHKGANILFFFLIVALVMLASCTVVKNYPADKPFVFSNKIIVEGNASKDEKKRLQVELQNYWDDSLKASPITQLGIRTLIKNPNVYDSTKINPSITFMNSYLNSQGYYNGVFTPKADTVIVRDQARVTVEMKVNVNPNIKISSFTFDSLSKKELRELAVANSSESLLNNKIPFTKQLISSELDRLVNLYRKNGFYSLTRDNLYAEVDTSETALLDLTLDPFEQARRIAEATQRRKLNPTISVSIRDKPSNDTSGFTKYYIGKIYFYPETNNEIPDSLIGKKFPIVTTQREYTMFQKEGLVRFRPLREHSFLREGRVYNADDYFKTINAFSALGAWNQVDVRTIARKDTAAILDFHFFLTPAKKYSFGSDLEVSRNSGSILTGNLLGIAWVNTLRNRNVWRSSVQSSTNVRLGVELGFSDTSSLLQTSQLSFSQTYSIPRFIVPFRMTGLKTLDDYKTVVNFNAGYTDRRNYFRLRSLVAGWGYEWKKKSQVWLYRPLNIELYSLDTLPGLRVAFDKNPFLRTAFNTGYVVSQNATFSYAFPGKRNSGVSNFFRISVEEAGAILGRLKALRDNLYQYIKAEGEFSQLRQFGKTSLAYRLFGGVGYNYSKDLIIGQSLPFFKQFVAGGPNSMRAWPLRQLGLGSSLLSDTSTVFRDRYGDIQLEGNVEYRFPIAVIGGVKVGSALFIDAGNIWNLKNNVANENSKLSYDRFGRDIAIGAGIGVLRLDFNYFIIRLDAAYKVKDPARTENGGWMSIRDFTWRNKEYSNIAQDGRLLRRNNYAIQLGIGLPF